MTGPPAGQRHRAAFGLLTLLFFMWGFITALNDSATQAMLGA